MTGSSDSTHPGVDDQAAPLRLEVFTSPTRTIPGGKNTFSPITSTLVLGEHDALLVDAQFIIEDVEALGDMVEAAGQTLKFIFITHGHADHYFGIGRLVERFPGARPVATPAVADYIQRNHDHEVAAFRGLFGDLVVEAAVLPRPLEGDVLLLDGQELRAIDVGQGDIAPSSVLHIPSSDAVIAGDVACNRIHQMLALSGPQEWKAWIESVDEIERLDPKIVIAGHKKPEAPDDDVAGILDGTRAYISDFAEAVSAATSASDIVTVMTDKYPDRGNLTTLIVSASAAVQRKTPA
jgi:glyoxylase-like metal-dependent hydrolase (beta-lactamase superfamily II)